MRAIPFSALLSASLLMASLDVTLGNVSSGLTISLP